MKGRSLSFEQLRIVNQHPSFVGVAAELVQYNNKYENVVSNLLGTVIVAKDLRGRMSWRNNCNTAIAL